MATGSDHFAFHLLLATACNSLAGWMRVIGGPNYWLALTGSILGGFCSSGLFVCLPRIRKFHLIASLMAISICSGC